VDDDHPFGINRYYTFIRTPISAGTDGGSLAVIIKADQDWVVIYWVYSCAWAFARECTAGMKAYPRSGYFTDWCWIGIMDAVLETW